MSKTNMTKRSVPDANKAQFLRGIKGTNEILNYSEPQIAFVGRSNVGKSSTINAVVGHGHLARASARPGKTTELNFFLVEHKLFVDFPGYGFARRGEGEREQLRKMIIWYFTSGEAKPKKTIVIIDAQVGITDYDRDMFEILRGYKHPFVVVANKIDRLNQKERAQLKKSLEEELRDASVIYFSAKERTGLDVLRNEIFA